MKPLQSNEFTLLLAPIAAVNTERTASIALEDADYLTIDVTVGVEANTNAADVALVLNERDGSSGSWVKIAEFDVDNTAAAKHQFHVDGRGRKQNLQLVVTPGTHTTNDAVITSATAIKVKDIKTASAGTIV